MKLFLGGVIVFLSFFNGALGECEQGTQTFTDLSGEFSSPNYPGNYPDTQRCTYRFNTGYPIIITCQEFVLQDANGRGECQMDFLSVVNDNKKYCGTDGPSDHYINNTDTVIRLLFRSDDSTNESGFSCTYDSVVDDTTTSTTTTTPTTTTTTTTTTTAATTIAVPDLLQNALDDFAANSVANCDTTSQNMCGCSDAEKVSEFYISTVGNYRLVVTTGIPNHDHESNANRNTACPHKSYFAMPLNPVKGRAYRPNRMGPIGVALSGGYFYDHRSDISGNTAVFNEGDSFDDCMGHSDPNCRYHYHKLPVCFAGSNCSHLGYLGDGFKVYSYCSHETEDRYLTSCYVLNEGEDGDHTDDYTYDDTAYANGDCDLDEANGYTFSDERGYAYIFTEDYPYIMSGHYGTEFNRVCYLYDY